VSASIYDVLAKKSNDGQQVEVKAVLVCCGNLCWLVANEDCLEASDQAVLLDRDQLIEDLYSNAPAQNGRYAFVLPAIVKGCIEITRKKPFQLSLSSISFLQVSSEIDTYLVVNDPNEP